MAKFIVEMDCDGYDTEEEMIAGCIAAIEDIDSSGVSIISVEHVEEDDH